MEQEISNSLLEKMRNMDILSLDKAELVDLKDISINEMLPKNERIIDFMQQIKNPYCFKVGSVVVKVQFMDESASLEEKLKSYLLSKC